MASLIEAQKNHLLSTLNSIKTSNNLKYLIIDERTEELINYIIDKNELLRYVTAIERIDSPRKLQPSIEAVYLIQPSAFTINCLLADVHVSPTRYKAGYGLFLPGLDAKLSEKLSNDKMKHYLRSIQLFTFNCFPKESNVFVSDYMTPNPLPIYYNRDCLDLVRKQVEISVDALVNVMVTLGELPMIRYYTPNKPINSSSVLPKLIADLFQTKIDNYARTNPNFPPPSQRPRSIVIITDRTLDLFAPILHEFTYQAMAFDVIEFKSGDTYVYETENEKNEIVEKETKLSDSDSDWCDLRHLHILESSEAIVRKVNELIIKNPLMVDRSNATTSTDLLYIVAHLKGFDEERRQITLHKKLIDECLAVNNIRKLAESADFEQNCAADGISFEGEKVKNMGVELVELLSQESFNSIDKLRFIMIYAIYRGGLIESDFRKLLQFINFKNIEPTLNLFKNFNNLGFQLVKSNVKDKKFKIEKFHTINNEGAFNTSRFEPAIKTVISKAITNQLDESFFPYFRDKPLEEEGNLSQQEKTNLRNPKHKASWAKPANKYSPPKQRIFYFIAGGMTYSEIRAAYELSGSLDKDVYIGSDCILTPQSFLDGVGDISLPRSELKLPIDLAMKKSDKAPSFLMELPKIKSSQSQPNLNKANGDSNHRPNNISNHSTNNVGNDQSTAFSSQSDAFEINKKEKVKKMARFKKFLK